MVTLNHIRSSSYKIFSSLIFLLVFTKLSAQYKISGKVTDVNLQPISRVSVRVDELGSGTTTNDDGNYSVNAKTGKYTLIFTFIGYKTQSITVNVNDDNAVQNVIMEEENKALEEVSIVITRKDRAEEIIKNVIRQKQSTQSAVENYSCNVYIKAAQENDAISRSIKVLSRPIKNKDDFSKMSMAEILLKLYHGYPDKVKEIREGVKLRGKTDDLFFLTTTTADFNFYNNLVKVPALTQIPMLSPISYAGLSAYKFKTLNIRKENGRKIYTIKVIPSASGNALVEGEVEVIDSSFVLLTTHFDFPKYHLTDYENFSVDQQYEFINNKAWMPIKQEFNYTLRAGKDKFRGSTTAIYYNYVTDTSFSRNYFGVEVSATSEDAYKRTDAFWEGVRQGTLTSKEFRFIEHSDSIYAATHTRRYLDSVDREYNKITFAKVFFYGQGIYDRTKEKTITLPPLIKVIKPFELGGLRISADASYDKIFPSKKRLTVQTDLSYGFRNKDVKGHVIINRLYNPFNWAYFIINGGREFAYIYGNDAWINGLKKSNLYEKYSLSVENGFELSNGLYIVDNLEFAARNSVASYKFGSKFDTLFRNTIPQSPPIAFDPYNAVYNNITVSFTPHQLYRREPKQKVNLGSKWPTFSVIWRKGIPGLLDSKINFDYLEFSIKQKLKLGLAGISEYSFITGSFLNTRKVGIVDYKYMRRGDPLLFTEPSRNFQALDSTFPVFKRFYEGHYSHNFNGAIINRISFLKRWNISEIVGGGILFLPEAKLNYVEGFAGLEKILRIFNEKIKIGGFVVGSVANKYNNPLQFKFVLQYYNRTTKRWM